MQVMHEVCCGLDVHKKSVMACVLWASGRRRQTLLSPDVAEYFPHEKSVNTALPTLIHLAKGPRRRAR
jgi:hypothetical protein